MKTFLIILGLLVAVLLVAYLVIKKNVEDNISGTFNSFKISNIGGGLVNPKADITLSFNIQNDSNYSFKLNTFKVKIYDNTTGEFLTENIVKETLLIPKGSSTHEVTLLNNKIIGNLQTFLEAKASYLAIVTFKIYGVNIEFEQQLEL